MKPASGRRAAKRGRTCRPHLFVFLAVLGLGAALGFGCAARDREAIRSDGEVRGFYIKGVPFYRQTDSTCGPAALANLFAFWGRPLPVEEIAAKIYLPEVRGTLPMDMEKFARDAGFSVMSSYGTLPELKEHIRSGTPVICLLDLGFGLYRNPHYITAIGFDDTGAVIIEHDGLKSDRLLEYEAFDKAWSRAGRWMLVIKPKEAEKKHAS